MNTHYIVFLYPISLFVETSWRIRVEDGRVSNFIDSELPLKQDIKIPWLFPDLSLTYLHFSLTNQTYKY